MKVHIAFPFSEGPSGGGNRFLLALREEFRARGAYTERIDEAQAVFFNSHHFSARSGILDALVSARARSTGRPVLIHRVDGPISVVRGTAVDHLVDQSIALFNGVLADATVFQSQWSASVCRRMGLGTGQATTVIGNAPESRYFHPAGGRAGRTGPLRIIATSWSANWRKGFDIYRWLDSHLDPARFRMTFVGNSPVRFKRIEHLSAIDSAGLGQVLRAHDVYITASVDDPCSNALIEAMACGLTPVARRSGGHPEIVGGSGVLFDGRHDVIEALEQAAGIASHSGLAPAALPDIGQVAQRYLAFAEAVQQQRAQGAHAGRREPGWPQRQSLRVSMGVQRYLPPLARRLCRALPVQGHRLLGDVALLRQADWEPAIEGAWGLDDARVWVRGVHNRLPVFLDSLRHPADQRLYRYTLTGDLRASPSLASSVLAAQVRRMAGLLDDEERQALGGHILSFQQADGAISDGWVRRHGAACRIAEAAWRLDPRRLTGREDVRAQTRQAFAALECLGRAPSRPFLEMPRSRAFVEARLHQLDWRKPGEAASQVGDLVFFMARHARCFPEASPGDITALEVLDHVERTCRQADGSWHAPGARVDVADKVDAAMKMLSALDVAGRETFANPEGLIDLCLSLAGSGRARDHTQVVGVLHRCTSLSHHRADEVRRYLLDRLRLYRGHHWPWSGGFSFFPAGANHRYHGARVSMGMPEPDIHGTARVLGGIVLINEALGLCPELPLRRPVT